MRQRLVDTAAVTAAGYRIDAAAAVGVPPDPVVTVAYEGVEQLQPDTTGTIAVRFTALNMPAPVAAMRLSIASAVDQQIYAVEGISSLLGEEGGAVARLTTGATGAFPTVAVADPQALAGTGWVLSSTLALPRGDYALVTELLDARGDALGGAQVAFVSVGGGRPVTSTTVASPTSPTTPPATVGPTGPGATTTAPRTTTPTTTTVRPTTTASEHHAARGAEHDGRTGSDDGTDDDHAAVDDLRGVDVRTLGHHTAVDDRRRDHVDDDASDDDDGRCGADHPTEYDPEQLADHHGGRPAHHDATTSRLDAGQLPDHVDDAAVRDARRRHTADDHRRLPDLAGVRVVRRQGHRRGAVHRWHHAPAPLAGSADGRCDGRGREVHARHRVPPAPRSRVHLRDGAGADDHGGRADHDAGRDVDDRSTGHQHDGPPDGNDDACDQPGLDRAARDDHDDGTGDHHHGAAFDDDPLADGRAATAPATVDGRDLDARARVLASARLHRQPVRGDDPLRARRVPECRCAGELVVPLGGRLPDLPAQLRRLGRRRRSAISAASLERLDHLALLGVDVIWLSPI